MTLLPPPKNSPPPARNDKPLPGTESGERDAWSLRLATLSGIPLRLHFTFLLILIYYAVVGIGTGTGGTLVLFLLGIFACVALHEYGHSLVAQRLGYTVRDIVLYPIGGVASIEGTPRARHELVIAVAGPAVNVVIALILGTVLAARPGGFAGNVTLQTMFQTGDLLHRLLAANIMLVVFNMIPAFPMDGGRVLRAALSLKLGRRRATSIAAGVGQFVALLLGLAGLGLFRNAGIPGNFALTLIALFVYFGAGQENQAEQSREIVEGVPVESAMVRQFETLEVGDSLKRAAEVLLATSQQDFPVLFGDDVVGVLSRNALLRGLAQSGETAYVSGVMSRDVMIVRPDEPLDDVLMRPNGVRYAPVLVMRDGRLLGMLTADNLMEFLTLRQIQRDRDERDEAEDEAARRHDRAA